MTYRLSEFDYQEFIEIVVREDPYLAVSYDVEKGVSELSDVETLNYSEHMIEPNSFSQNTKRCLVATVLDGQINRPRRKYKDCYKDLEID
jgi:hypothetical protein